MPGGSACTGSVKDAFTPSRCSFTAAWPMWGEAMHITSVGLSAAGHPQPSVRGDGVERAAAAGHGQQQQHAKWESLVSRRRILVYDGR